MGVITIVPGNSLVVQEWLGLCAFTDKGPGSIPGWGTKVLPWRTGMERSCVPESENDGESGGWGTGALRGVQTSLWDPKRRLRTHALFGCTPSDATSFPQAVSVQARGWMVSVWPWLPRHGHDTPSLLSGEAGMNEAPLPSPTPIWGWNGSQEMEIPRAGANPASSPGLASHSFLPPQVSSDSPALTHTHTSWICLLLHFLWRNSTT